MDAKQARHFPSLRPDAMIHRVHPPLFARTDPSSSLPMPETVATKPYDWTYTTTYTGHQQTSSASSPHLSWRLADPEEPSNAIPMAELSRPDPILFYAEVPLFEDELHDNGSSSLLVRIVRESIRIHKRPYPKILACNARLLFHFISIHPARRSCPIQDI